MGKEIPLKTYNLKNITLATSVPPMGTQCNITDWGKTSGPKDAVYAYAQTGTVNLLTMDHCEKFYKAIPDNTLCFGSTGVAVCLVSAGGRMVWQRNKE